MTTTTTPSLQQELRYRQDYWTEYVRMSGFLQDMGSTPMSIIHTAMEAVTSGKTVKYPLVSRLKNAGVYGNAKIGGSEEALNKHEWLVSVEYRRNAVELSKREEHFDYAKARDKVAPLLKEWSMQQLRNNIIDGLRMVAPGKVFGTAMVPGDGSTTINATGSSTDLNTWLTANGDWTNAAGNGTKARVLFGNAKANTTYVSTVPQFTTSLANVTSSMKLTRSAIMTMKRIAKQTDPHIRPIRIEDGDGREYFKMYCGSEAFRDLKMDASIILDNQTARAREGNGMDRNPLFQDGDLIVDGVIVKEIPEIPVIEGAGASGINVAPVFLCGAQAIGVAWGQYPRFTQKKETDYDFFEGIGIEEAIGVGKFQRNMTSPSSIVIDNGIVTNFVAGVSDG